MLPEKPVGAGGREGGRVGGGTEHHLAGRKGQLGAKNERLKKKTNFKCHIV